MLTSLCFSKQTGHSYAINTTGSFSTSFDVCALFELIILLDKLSVDCTKSGKDTATDVRLLKLNLKKKRLISFKI